jgi:hypothetical protein
MKRSLEVLTLGLVALVTACEQSTNLVTQPARSEGSALLVPGAQARIGPGVRDAIRENGRARVMIALAGDVSAFAVRSPRDLPNVARAIAGTQAQALAGLQPGDIAIAHRYESVAAIAGTLRNEAALDRLAANPAVRRIDLDIGGTGTLATSVPQINADLRHALGNDGEGVIVGVLDSGIDSDHPDLSDDIGQQACFGDNDGAIDGAGFCPNGSDRQTGAGSAEDDQGHGSHVSGIITSNGTQSSVGVAPGANIVAVKVLDNLNRFFFTSEVVAGLNWIINNNSTGLNLGVQVINMSLGTSALFTFPCDNVSANTMAMAGAINTLRGMGVITMVSAGNNSSSTQMTLPACVTNAIAVGAVDASDAVAGFSNSDAGTDVFAPGVSIVSSGLGGGTATLSGTSMASPHVAGCAALLIDSGEATMPNAIETRLETSNVQITDTRNSLTFPRLDCGPAGGTIIIRKATTPAGRTGFTFIDDIAAPNTFTLDDAGVKQFDDVVPGTYTVTESAPGSFMTLSSLVCTDPTTNSTTDLALRTATINVASNETVDCTFTNSDQAPAVTVTPASQTVQYSDHVADITVTGQDSDQDALTAGFSFSLNGGAFGAGLPAGLSSTANGCTTVGDVQTCTWTIGGTAGVSAGTYMIRSTITDDDGDATSKDVTVVVNPEDASVSFDAGNPAGVQVAAPGGNSGLFSLTIYIEETEPDLATVAAAAGNIANAVASMNLVPVGPGSNAAGVCAPIGVTGTGYDQVLEVRCNFNGVPVNTYAATVTVAGGYYTGGSEDVLTVFDPSLGFTSGGGWINWPGTTDRTSFGYTMKYTRNGNNVKGSLLMIRHLPDGAKYRLKSNALYGLAIGSGTTFEWATFNGKATYLEPGWTDALGNYEFVTYVEDHGGPGDSDRFWIRILDKDGNVVAALSMTPTAPANAVSLQGGNIVVPHLNNGGK